MLSWNQDVAEDEAAKEGGEIAASDSLVDGLRLGG